MHNLNDFIVDNIKNTEIAKSDLHGNGLFATADINADEVLTTLDGQYISWEQYKDINKQFDKDFNDEKLKDTIFMEWNAINKDLLLVRAFRTKYSFINHSRTPNAIILQNPLRVATLNNIKKGEEILLDYRKEYLSDEYINGHGKTYL